MECVYSEIKNCQAGQKCPDGYECCSENVPSGGKPKFGLCVRSDQCDRSRGIPKRSCRDEQYRQNMPAQIERFQIYSSEGYNDTKECKNNMWMMFIIFCIVLFVLFCLKVCKKYKNKK